MVPVESLDEDSAIGGQIVQESVLLMGGVLHKDECLEVMVDEGCFSSSLVAAGNVAEWRERRERKTAIRQTRNELKNRSLWLGLTLKPCK